MTTNQLKEPTSTLVIQNQQVQGTIVAAYEGRNAVPVTLASSSLAPDIQAALNAFDSEDMPDPDIADIRDIMTMDMPYHKEDNRLQFVRRQQAERLQGHIQRIGNTIRENEFFLGALIIYAEERNLGSYLNYTNVTEWCNDLGIRNDVVRKATALYRIWPHWNALGYSLVDLLGGDIDEIKVRFIEGQKRKKNEVLSAVTIEVIRAKNPDLLPDDLTAIPENKWSTQVAKIVRDLPTEEREDIHQQAFTIYTDRARAEIDHIREERDTDLLYEHQEKMGEPEKPFFNITVEWYDNQLVPIHMNTIPFALQHASSAAKNQFRLRFKLVRINHEPTDNPDESLSLSQLGTLLNMVATTDTTYMVDSEEDDDDKEEYPQ